MLQKSDSQRWERGEEVCAQGALMELPPLCFLTHSLSPQTDGK